MLTVYARKVLTGDKRRRWLMLNCYRWRLVWLPD